MEKRCFLSRPRLEELEGRLVPSTSTNWSGYAVEATRGSVTAVSATWKVPTLTGSGTGYSATWVGIDGATSRTVEQIGTEADMVHGRPAYSAWFEMYPKGSKNLDLQVRPGDTISASVTYGSDGKFHLSISDNTSGQSFSTSQAAPKAARSSAEWVVEAPFAGGILPLAGFGTETFTSASATVGGKTGGIDQVGGKVDAITMTNGSGKSIATPSPASDSGTSSTFSVASSVPARSTSQPLVVVLFREVNLPGPVPAPVPLANLLPLAQINPSVTTGFPLPASSSVPFASTFMGRNDVPYNLARLGGSADLPPPEEEPSEQIPPPRLMPPGEDGNGPAVPPKANPEGKEGASPDRQAPAFEHLFGIEADDSGFLNSGWALAGPEAPEATPDREAEQGEATVEARLGLLFAAGLGCTWRVVREEAEERRRRFWR